MAFVNDRRIEAAFAFGDPIQSSQEFLPDLVGRIGLSRHYNRRVVHSILGMKPYRIEAALKLGYAYRELLFTDTPIIQVSQQAGFAFQSAFSRAFKDYFLSTPREIRSHGQASAFRKPLSSGAMASKVVSVPEIPVLRRVYLKMREGEAGEAAAALEMNSVHRSILDIARTERSATMYVSGFYLPAECCVNEISLVAIAPETAELSPGLSSHFARDGIYTKIFRDEYYLQLSFDPPMAKGFDEVKDFVAHWVRNQRTYTIGQKLWIEQSRLEDGRPVGADLFIPLERA